MDTLKGINWLISLLAAIPLSIAANLLTPFIRDWFARRSSQKAATRLEEIEKELVFVSEMAASERELLRFVLWSLLRVLVYFAMASAIATLGSMPWAIMPIRSDIVGPAFAAVGAISAMLYLLAVLRGNDAAKVLWQVRHFEKYKADIEARMAKLGAVRSSNASAGGTP
jgi:hypothetical protein